MKARKAQDLRSLSTEEIVAFIAEAQESLTRLRFRSALGQLDDSSSLKTLRKDVARMKTILHERKNNDN
ncbi:MAG: 50S ribosomal protein L29 [Candidatus Kapaibacteriota bacterium]|jgi:large subunit ribosomal protein L29